MIRRDLTLRLKAMLEQVRAASQLPSTSRETFLAVSEYARRLAGDVPGGGALRDLAPFELKVFSQNGEDGVIAEIVRRVGPAERFFVEFGAATAAENNCVALADLAGWGGLFIEAAEQEAAAAKRKYAGSRRVRVLRATVTPGNVDQLFADNHVPAEPALLSIDVDGGDYWIWEGLRGHRPRIVVIEYNGSLEPGTRLVQPKDRGAWDRTEYFGASIEALVALGAEKGYRLVHCELTGNNAFFVREDLAEDFLDPAEIPRRATNLWLEGLRHEPDRLARSYVNLDRES